MSGSVEKEPRRNLNSSESRNLLGSTKALKFEDVDFPNKLGTKKDDTTEKVKCFVEFQSIF